MGSSGFNFVITWGFLGLGLGILLVIKRGQVPFSFLMSIGREER